MGDKAEGPKLADYYMSIHYGICATPINALRRIFIGGKRAWRGNVTTQRTFRIDEPDLYEGDEQEGGVGGAVHFLPGGVTQVLPENLAGRLDLTSDTCPAFRGLTSIWMYGEEDEGFGVIAGADGFYWGTNNPYLKPTSVEVTCIPLDWYGAKAQIDRGTGGEPAFDGYIVNESSLSANRQQKFDTLGFINARIEDATVDGGNVRLWSIPDNVATVWNPGFEFGSRGCHITIDGMIVTRKYHPAGGEGDIYFFNFEGIEVARVTSTMGALGLNFAIVMCDIMIGSDHYLVGHATDGGGPPDKQYFRIKNHGQFRQDATADGLNDPREMSLGPQYAYLVAAPPSSSATSVYLVEWIGADDSAPITSTEVTPPGLTGNIANCAYDSATDSVIIVCTNGDLFKYSPDLTTLLASNLLTGIGTVLVEQASNKRMCPGDGRVVMVRHEGSGLSWKVFVFSTSDLSEIDRFDSLAQDTWAAPTSNYDFMKFNLMFDALFMVQHSNKMSMWPLPQPAIPDMNPSHIIYHSLTNTDWGMASPIANIDEASFISAADVLFTEGFGLSMMWSQQTTIEEFIKDILNHINATLFVRPSTGLLNLKLIRNDYDVGTLPVLNRDNSRVMSYARKGWGDTVNEVNVSWTNPENEEDETVTMQDLGNISMQGGVVSTSKNYHGIRKKDLAKTVAARDITAESWPVATAQVEVNREAWDYVPGDCVKLTVEEYGVALLVMRITTVDYGKPGDSKIKLSLVEDIFGLPLAEFVDEPPGSLWEDPNEDPRPIDFALPLTLTYFHAKKVGSVSGAVYPEVRAGMFAAQGGNDTTHFKLLGPTVDAAGNETLYDTLGTRSILSRATLVTGFDAEAETIVTSADWTARSQGAGPVAGGFILIGDGEETENELALVSSVSSGSYTLKRGVLDTVPQDWPAGTPIWFFSNNSRVSDPITRAALDTISYKVLPVTSNGTLNAGAASPIPLTLTERPWLPTRPADVTVEGIGFGIVDVSFDSPPATDVLVEWSTRNRLTEDSQVLAWDAAGVTVEASQTTTVEVLELDRTLITAHTGLTGSSFNLPIASFGAFSSAIVRVTSERDGYESLQGHEIIVVIAPENLTITPPQGNLVLSTVAPSDESILPLQPPQGNLVLSSVAPSVFMPMGLSPPSANLVISSTAPTNTAAASISPPSANLVLSSVAPTISESAPLDGLGPTGAWSFSRDLFTAWGGAPYYVEVSGEIDVLKDQSGNARDLQAAPAQRPVIGTGAPNNRACGVFNSTDTTCLESAVGLANFFAVGSGFMVVSFRPTLINTNVANMWANEGVISDSGGFFGIILKSGDTLNAFHWDGTSDVVSEAAIEGTVYVASWRHEGGNLYLSVNGGAEASVASTNTAAGYTAHVLRMGNGIGNNSACSMDGEIFEAVIFSTVPPQANREAIVADFMDWLGVAGLSTNKSPAAANLVLSSAAPTAEIGGSTTLSPAAANLALSSTAPTVLIGGSSRVPPQGNLVLSSSAPTVGIAGGSLSRDPPQGNLILSTTAPTVEAEGDTAPFGSLVLDDGTSLLLLDDGTSELIEAE